MGRSGVAGLRLGIKIWTPFGEVVNGEIDDKRVADYLDGLGYTLKPCPGGVPVFNPFEAHFEEIRSRERLLYERA